MMILWFRFEWLKCGKSDGEGKRVDKFTFGFEIPEDIHEMAYRMSIALCFLYRMFSAQLIMEARLLWSQFYRWEMKFTKAKVTYARPILDLFHSKPKPLKQFHSFSHISKQKHSRNHCSLFPTCIACFDLLSLTSVTYTHQTLNLSSAGINVLTNTEA